GVPRTKPGEAWEPVRVRSAETDPAWSAAQQGAAVQPSFVKMSGKVTPGADDGTPFPDNLPTSDKHIGQRKDSGEEAAAAKATAEQGRVTDGKPAGLLDSWGTAHTASGEVVFQLKDSNGVETRWTTTPIFAKDLSNRLLASATKAQQMLQAGAIKEGG